MESRRTKTILVVDDEPDIQSLLEDFLTDCDYNVVVAKDGVGALYGYIQIKPDLILLDIKMPLLDGIGVLTKIAAMPTSSTDNWRPYVIVMTGHADREKILKVKGLNADDVISKPFELDDLLRRIEKCLGAGAKRVG